MFAIVAIVDGDLFPPMVGRMGEVGLTGVLLRIDAVSSAGPANDVHALPGVQVPDAEIVST